ncbi:MAG TPA: hypothetical protein VMR54_03830 [Thermoanaerobaculia bacterium]|nr:hypothetical protein [Thermoanaerobaculia bacterium]
MTLAAGTRLGPDGRQEIAQSGDRLRADDKRRGISWSPDGGSLVVGQYECRSDIVLLTRDR